MNPLQSNIFAAVASLLFFPVNLFALHLLLRGHDAPGGGFEAGAGTALSLILLGLALGVERLQRIVRVDPVRLAAVGLATAFAFALLPMLWGDALLEHRRWEYEGVPMLGHVTLSTALGFDTGVYLLVVGTLTKMLMVFARSIVGLGAFAPGEEARYSSSVEKPIEPASPSARRRRQNTTTPERHAD